MARLTLAQQRKLIRALPASRIQAVKKHCMKCEQKGDGITKILKSIGKVLGPVAKEIGPVVLKELIVPFIKGKIRGNGLNPPGTGLKLAGKGKTKRKRKARKKM